MKENFSIALTFLLISGSSFGFSSKMRCKVDGIEGNLAIIGERANEPGHIEVGDLAFFDTNLDRMYLHPAHKKIRFENWRGEISQIYSCTTIEKKVDSEDVTFYDDDGYEGFELSLQRIGNSEEFSGMISSEFNGNDGSVYLTCVMTSAF